MFALTHCYCTLLTSELSANICVSLVPYIWDYAFLLSCCPVLFNIVDFFLILMSLYPSVYIFCTVSAVLFLFCFAHPSEYDERFLCYKPRREQYFKGRPNLTDEVAVLKISKHGCLENIVTFTGVVLMTFSILRHCPICD